MSAKVGFRGEMSSFAPAYMRIRDLMKPGLMGGTARPMMNAESDVSQALEADLA